MRKQPIFGILSHKQNIQSRFHAVNAAINRNLRFHSMNEDQIKKNFYEWFQFFLLTHKCWNSLNSRKQKRYFIHHFLVYNVCRCTTVCYKRKRTNSIFGSKINIEYISYLHLARIMFHFGFSLCYFHLFHRIIGSLEFLLSFFSLNVFV